MLPSFVLKTELLHHRQECYYIFIDFRASVCTFFSFSFFFCLFSKFLQQFCEVVDEYFHSCFVEEEGVLREDVYLT